MLAHLTGKRERKDHNLLGFLPSLELLLFIDRADRAGLTAEHRTRRQVSHIFVDHLPTQVLISPETDPDSAGKLTHPRDRYPRRQMTTRSSCRR